MFCVYVLRCRDGTLYTGYTHDIKRRLSMHSKGKASKYTRSRLPVKLVATWNFQSKSEAMKQEIAFKSLPRKDKLEALKLGF